MSCELHKVGIRTRLLAAAVALVLAGSAQAITQVGGGATLPSVGYLGPNAATTTNLQFIGIGVGPTNIYAASLFGAVQTAYGNPVSYCLTGSGAGKSILAGAGSTTASCTPAMTGFGGAAAGRFDLTQPNFAAADSPLSAADLTAYHSGRGAAAWPTQFPAVAGAVGITFNLKDTTGAQITSASFTTVQLCKIFSHTITNWSDATLASAFTLPPGHVVPSVAINLQYRRDGSGTTFAFSNFLTNNCGSAGLAHVFETSQTFGSTTGMPSSAAATNSVVSMFFPPLPIPPTLLPSNWVGSSGDTGVAMAVSGTPNSIGYVEAANVHQLNLVGVTNLALAKVNGRDPLTDFGAPVNVNVAAIVYNELIGSNNNGNGTATVTPILSAPPTQCIALVPPASYAVAGSKGGLLPTSSYPIVAISYLLGNAQSNEPIDLVATQNLVNAPYNATVKSLVSPGLIGPGTGLAFLNLGTGAFSPTAPGACLH